MNTFGIDLHLMNKTPPPQTFTPNRRGPHNQATSQRQYHNPFSEQAVSPWQQDRLNNHSDGNAGFISGFGLTQNTPPDNSSSPSSLGWGSQGSTTDSYGSSNTSYSQGSGSIGPRFMPGGSSPENPYQIIFTGVPLVTSPEELVATAPSPALFDQSGPAAQAIVYATHPTGGYFGCTHDYSQSLVEEEQRQNQGFHPNLNTRSFVPSPSLPPPPPPPPQPVHPGKGCVIADHPNQNLYVCECGVSCGRRTDLERHQRTAKRHKGDWHGLVCPVKGCKYPSKFTREDNFRTHCRRHKKMSEYEINTYIRGWKDQRMA